MQGRYRGDTWEIQGRYMGDTEEIPASSRQRRARCRGDTGEIQGRYRGDTCIISSEEGPMQCRPTMRSSGPRSTSLSDVFTWVALRVGASG